MNKSFINLIMIMLIFMVFLFFSSKIKFHPLIYAMILVFYIFFFSLNMNFYSSNYWYSYLMFLVMIGGLMILFIYFSSIAGNEIIIFTKFHMLEFCLKFIIFLVLLKILFNNMIYLLNNDYLEVFVFYMCFFYEELNLKNLYMDYSMDLNLFVIFYLFFTMICSVLICMKVMKPFRQFKK